MDERTQDEDRTTAALLNSSAIHLLRGLREADRATNLTPARLSALSVIVFGGAIPLGRLARTEGVTGPTMTGIVDGLSHLGLARREAHPENARTTMIHATDHGERVMRDAAQRRFDAIVEALQRLDIDERQLLREAAPLLRRLADLVRGQS